jgi:hypothetical protein
MVSIHSLISYKFAFMSNCRHIVSAKRIGSAEGGNMEGLVHYHILQSTKLLPMVYENEQEEDG